MKIGRNEPCWCGSGIKYKKCHLKREEQSPINQGIIHKQINSFYDKKYCSVPKSIKHECTKKIIKAHSVSKSSSLKDISVDGHVLTTFKALSRDQLKSKILPKRIGINQASTFTGFCSRHDNELFLHIEDKVFEVTPHNCFLVAYRAIARELFVKERSSGTLDLIREMDKGQNLQRQLAIQKDHKHFSKNNDLTTNDLKHIKTIYDTCLETNDFDPINHMVFHLNKTPSVMTSAIVAPSFDFQGNVIQEISDNPNIIPNYLAINVFSSNGFGYVVLSWLKEHEKICSKFCESLLKSKSPSDSLICFIFSAIENIYMSETWWNGLDDNYRNELVDIFAQGVQEPIYNDALITDNSYGAFEILNHNKIE